jgi:hypothetical protein
MQGAYLRRKCSGKAIKILQPQIHESEKNDNRNTRISYERETHNNNRRIPRHITQQKGKRKRTRVLGGGGSKRKSKENEQDIPKRIALAKNQKGERERTKREREWLKKKMYIRKEETRRHATMLGRSCCCCSSLPSFLLLSPLLVFFLVRSTCCLCTPSYSRSKKHGGVQNKERDKGTLNSSQHLMTTNFPPKNKEL